MKISYFNKHRGFYWLLICIPVICGAALLTNQSNSDIEDMAALKSLNAKFINNFITNDTVSHGQIIHKNFVCITAKGRWLQRKEYITGWASGYDSTAMPYFDYRDERITIYGNMALVRAVTKYISRKDGKETTGMTQYTDIYIRENGKWKCVQAQLTALAPENYPDDNTVVRRYRNGRIQ